MPSASRHPYRLQAIAYGVGLEVRSDDEALLQRARGYLPFGAEVEPGAAATHSFVLLRATVDRPYRLRRDNRTVFRDRRPEAVLDRLRSLLTLAAAEHSPDRIFIHAGVAGWNGGAILVPGRSFAGKTTLTAELVRAGACYYSDEYAVVDAEGLIYPYAQPLQMRSPGSLSQFDTDVSALDGRVGSEPLRACLMAFSQFQLGAEWVPRTLSPGHAVLELMRHTISARREPAVVMKTLTRLIDGAQAVRSPRGEASITAAAILRSLSVAGGG